MLFRSNIADTIVDITRLGKDLKDYQLRVDTAKVAYENTCAALKAEIAALEAAKAAAAAKLAAEEEAIKRGIEAQRMKDTSEYTAQLETLRTAVAATQAALESATAQVKQASDDRVQARLDAAEAKGEYEEYVARLAAAKQEALAKLT